MPKVELRQVVGKFTDRLGRVRSAAWPTDILLLNGLQIATMNRVPGAAIHLLPHVGALTPSEELAVMEVVKASVRGQYPAAIIPPIKTPYQLMDEDDEVEAGAGLENEDDDE